MSDSIGEREMLSTDRLIGTLIERTEALGRELHSMNSKLDSLASMADAKNGILEARVVALEMKWAERAGSNRMAILVFGSAATVGGLVATAAGNLFKVFGGG